MIGIVIGKENEGNKRVKKLNFYETRIIRVSPNRRENKKKISNNNNDNKNRRKRYYRGNFIRREMKDELCISEKALSDKLIPVSER